MNEYLLKPNDLNDLRKFQRRSPYANEPPITVYLRKDIEAKALQIWGSFDALHKALLKRKEEEQKYSDSLFKLNDLSSDSNPINVFQAFFMSRNCSKITKDSMTRKLK